MGKRENYSTTLDGALVEKLKIQAILEKRYANDIIEESLEDYFKKIKRKIK